MQLRVLHTEHKQEKKLLKKYKRMTEMIEINE